MNHSEAIFQIRKVLDLPQDTAPHQVVAKVRELKATADLAGAALQAREHFTPQADRRGTRDHRIA
jgi:hypothetical protein